MILILGAPRTGSTLLYQLIVNHFRVNYFDNAGNVRTAEDAPVPLYSEFGKTLKEHEPSEASQVLARWWGEMDRPLPGMEQRMITTLKAAEPIVIKNIWNVYRVDEWVRMFPDVQFVWIRRDTHDAALSDLRARRKKQVGLNGAYLKFGEDLDGLKKDEQVVAQQKNINHTIEVNLQGKDYIQVWYHDICEDTAWELLRLEHFLRVERRYDRPIERLIPHES